ncbi:beta-lactamase [Labrys miyagiensis]|uniref:Beta-lactamase n=1 Tax=Labrys miyagiensis TaxID=346912 RepID=A0ABQ6CDS1_9HYPH|nr:beta-lactamase [Labrys miyagiensis]
MLLSRRQALAGSLLALPLLSGRSATAQTARPSLRQAVDAAIVPLMQAHDVPGMAVAVTIGGKRSFFNYGVASRESGQKVGEDTLFELGSLSKTFTAILGGWAQARGALAFGDKASHHWPALAGSSFDEISLIDLGTYTAGGLPLQFPAGVKDEASMLGYFRSWRPAFAPGTRRLYSNPSIGLFGYLAARSLGQPFDALMQGTIFPGLGLKRAFITVRATEMESYAWGYAKANKPIRVGPGALDSEAYGVKISAAEMARYLEAVIDGAGLDDNFRRAIAVTQSGYDRIGGMVQGLGWEMYDDPVGLDRLLAGNSAEMARNANTVAPLDPPLPARRPLLANKTGSTNGFGAYAAFVPSKALGVAMLANRSYPNEARVTAAYGILSALEKWAG